MSTVLDFQKKTASLSFIENFFRFWIAGTLSVFSKKKSLTLQQKVSCFSNVWIISNITLISVFVISRKVRSFLLKYPTLAPKRKMCSSIQWTRRVTFLQNTPSLETRKVLDSYRNSRCSSVTLSLFFGPNCSFLFLESVSRFWNAGILSF